MPPVGDNNGFAPVLSASYWKESVNNLFMQRLSNNFKCVEVELLLDLLEIIHENTPTFQTYTEENVKETHIYKVKMKNCTCAALADKTLPYHVYLLVPRLRSGEADDFSRFSLLSCFHGLLERSTAEGAQVKTEVMRWMNSEAAAKRKKSGTFVLVHVSHLSRVRARAWKKTKTEKTQKIKF